MRGTGAVLLAFAVVVAAGPAAARARPAKDTKAPVIQHTPIDKHDGVGPLIVEAHITDDKSGVFEPTLLVRAAGTAQFTRVTMTPKAGAQDVYTAEVPKALLGGDVEYIIEAFDKNGNGPARVGSEDDPVKVVRDVPTVEDKPPPPPPPPPPPEDDGPSGALIGAGIAVGAVIVVGAVVGGGYLLYALRPAAPEVVAIKVKAPTPVGLAP